MTTPLFSRSQLVREASLTGADLAEVATCRGDPHRLGFAYQLGFVRVFQRFLVQQPLEICEELLSFVALQTGIVKVEQLHALARDVYYGRRGRINARELHEQMNSCSCLTLILACIIYWQANAIAERVRSGAAAEEGIDMRLLQHVSPIEWDNVILYGQYVLDRDRVR